MAKVRKTREINKKEDVVTIEQPLVEKQEPIQDEIKQEPIIENNIDNKEVKVEKPKQKVQSLADFLY